MVTVKKLLAIVFVILLVASPAFAADTDYFVECGLGSGTNNGLTPANAFQSLEDVNDAISGMTDGDDVYFKYGTTCTATAADSRFELDTLDGTDVDTTVIGCYEAVDDFDCTGQTYPIFDGDGSYPSANSGLINKSGQGTSGDHGNITIQQLHFQNMGQYGGGVYMDTGGGSGADEDGPVIVDDIEVENGDAKIARCVGIFKNLAGEVRNSYFHNIDSGGGGFACVTASAHENTFIWVHHNTFHDLNMEAVGIYVGANGTVEYNTFYDVEYYGIYFDNVGDTSIARHNLLYQTGALVGVGKGIGSNNEEGRCVGCCSWGQQTVLIYGNMIVGFNRGLQMSDQDDCDPTDWHYFNNILIDNNSNFLKWTHNFGVGNTFKNNISWLLTSGTTGHIDDCNPTGITFDNNLWFSETGAPDEPSSGNCTDGDEQIDPNLARTSGWRTELVAGSEDGSDVAPTETSPAFVKTGGTDMGNGYGLITYTTGLDYSAHPPTATTFDPDDFSGWPVGVMNFYDDPAPTITDPTPNEQNVATDGTPGCAGADDCFDITYNGDQTHYATDWKVILSGQSCDVGSAQGGSSSCNTATPGKIAWSWSGLSEDENYILCARTWEDIDSGSDCDAGEESAWGNQSFSTGGQPAGGQTVDANVITGTGTIRMDMEQSGSGTKNVDLGP